MIGFIVRFLSFTYWIQFCWSRALLYTLHHCLRRLMTFAMAALHQGAFVLSFLHFEGANSLCKFGRDFSIILYLSFTSAPSALSVALTWSLTKPILLKLLVQLEATQGWCKQGVIFTVTGSLLSNEDRLWTSVTSFTCLAIDDAMYLSAAIRGSPVPLHPRHTPQRPIQWQRSSERETAKIFWYHDVSYNGLITRTWPVYKI